MGISVMGNGCGFAEGTINSCHKSWFPPVPPDGPCRLPSSGSHRPATSQLILATWARRGNFISQLVFYAGEVRMTRFFNMILREEQLDPRVIEAGVEEIKENKIVC